MIHKTLAKGDICSMTQANDAISDVLRKAKRIALLGVSSRPDMPSYEVAKYLQSQGYQLIPVNKHDDAILGFPTVQSLADISGTVDVLAVFLDTGAPPAIKDDAKRLAVQAIWAQPGCSNEVRAACRDTGLPVYAGQCIMRDHKRLLAHADA